MSLTNPQMQWSLDQSAGSLWTFGSRFIEAATSDNVQLLALMTCESFGATLPVSIITRLKIETLARRNFSVTVAFLRAQIGYKAGDSADALSKSDGGLRFLCLAAILCTCSRSFVWSAEALDRMIRNNSGKLDRYPTVLQLRDLLEALSPKLSDSGFAADVMGWIPICISHAHPSATSHNHDFSDFRTPGPSGLVALVEAVQKCYRVGESRIKVVIKSSLSYIPWTIAAIKWLAGVTPLVISREGVSLLNSSDKLVSIEETESLNDFVISLRTGVDSIVQIISTKSKYPSGISTDCRIRGSLDAPSWLNVRMQDLDTDYDLAYRIITKSVTILPDVILLYGGANRRMVGINNANVLRTMSRLFPSPEIRQRSLNQLFPSRQCVSDFDLDDVLQEMIRNCSHTSRYISEPKQWPEVPTRDESLSTGADANDGSIKHIEPPSGYGCCFNEIGSIIADVLVLLLFSGGRDNDIYPELSLSGYIHRQWARDHVKSWPLDPDIQIQCYCEGQYRAARHRYSWQELIVHGWWRILSGQLHYLQSNTAVILRHVSLMMGDFKNYTSPSEELLVMFSGNGQVVYPSLLEIRAPVQQTFLHLTVQRGQLWWHDQTFTGVAAFGFTFRNSTVPIADASCASMPYRKKILDKELPENFVPSLESEPHVPYYVEIGSTISILYLQIDHFQQSGGPVIKPWDLFVGLSQAVFSPSCHHSPRTPANKRSVSEFILITEDDICKSRCIPHEHKYVLCNLKGKPFFQLLQLACFHELCLLFSQGCINCALAFAKKNEIRVVIC